MLRLFCRYVGTPLLSATCRCYTMSAGRIESQNFKKLVTPDLLRLEKLFKSKGYEFRLVGGAVRDLLLDKLPNDVDISTDCIPDNMIRMFKDENIRYIPTGLQHGTVTVVMKGISYEVSLNAIPGLYLKGGGNML